MIVAASLAWAAPVHRYAVVIGADTGRPDEEELLFAEADAQRVATVLTDLGGFRPEDTVLLRQPDAGRVRDVLAAVTERVGWDAREGAETLLLLYYSGHADADALHLGASSLELVELKEALEAVPVDVRLLVVDACQSGELTRLKGAVPADPFVIRAEDRLESEGMAIIASSSVGEDAQESDRLRGGVFTHHLVAGLLGAADASNDGRITLAEAYRYGYSQTIRSTSDARFVQHPTYAFDLRGRGEDIVLTALDDPGRNGTVRLATGGTWLLFSADRAGVQAEVTVAAGALLALPPGEYLVRLRDEDALREGTVEVVRGGSTAVSSADLAPVPFGQTVRRGLAEERRAAVALTAGGGVLGPTVPGIRPGALAALGVRVDLEPLSLGARAHYAPQGAENDTLALRQHLVGLDVHAVKWVDFGRLAPGVGVRAGGDLVAQSFDTPGVAPPRRALAGRLGPWLGADLALSGRSALSLTGGADVEIYRGLDDVLATLAVPHGTLEWVLYVR